MAGQRPTTVEELLVHASWLRGLARHLAKDPQLADDAVQDTWVAALRRAPEAGESVRPWLAKVLRNALRMRARGDGRRAAREQAAEIPGDEPLTPEALVARTEAQRLLADLVLRLDEPYRSTVLLHYGEGLALAEIARNQGIAAGTARWRLKVALEKLRAWLDAESGGRRGWALAPLMAIPKGALVAQKSMKITAAVLIILALLAGVVLVLRHGGKSDGGADDDGDRAASAATAFELDRPAISSTNDAETTAWLTQAGAAPRRIAGRVTFRGAPVADATVELASIASESGAVVAPVVRTNASGEFDFGQRPAMQWSVRASATGKTGASVAIDLRNPVERPRPDELVIELGPCQAAMVGTVRDASGGVIANARLARVTGGQSVPGGVSVRTDRDGAYELCVDKSWPGRVFVEVSAPGYGAILVQQLVLGRVTVDFALVPEAVIVGRVVRDDTGAPVAGAHVFLPYGPWRGIESTSRRGTFADQHGRFRIDQVAPGRHVVRAWAEGLVAPRRDTPIVVEAGQTSADIEIRMEAGSVVRGVVLEGGEPVAGARVEAIAADGVRSARTAMSQEDGSFALEEVPRGSVRFSAWPYDVVSPSSLQVERLVHDGVVIEVEPLGAIVGRVVRDGSPVAGARLHIHGPNERELGPLTTDDHGRFAARGLMPGPWDLVAESPRHGAFGRAPKTVQLTHGETEEVIIDLAYAAAISGVVVDQKGAPVPGAVVEFTHTAKDDAGVAVTSVDGSFRAALMTGGGHYRTTVRRHQGSGASLPSARGTELPLIRLEGGDSEVTGVVLRVQLDRHSIAGRLVDSTGSPVADARVTAAMVQGDTKPRFSRWMNYAATTSDVDGRFSIGELSEGTYALQARAPAGAEGTIGGIRAGRSDVVITLPAPGTIEGSFAGFRSQPDVFARPLDRAGPPAVPGRVSGQSFAIDELSPGRYSVTARTATEAASAEITVEAGAVARVTLTSAGTGSVAGRVREFRTGEPVQGMTCRAHLRLGDERIGVVPGDEVRTDAQGRFTLPDVPAGPIAVVCYGLFRLYSDGLRIVELPAGGRVDVEIPVVALQGDVAAMNAGFGAEIDMHSLVPTLVSVQPGGPAATAGLRDGDQVIAVDGAPVTELSPGGVRVLITNRQPGTTVALTVTRAGQTISADVVLGDGNGP